MSTSFTLNFYSRANCWMHNSYAFRLQMVQLVYYLHFIKVLAFFLTWFCCIVIKLCRNIAFSTKKLESMHISAMYILLMQLVFYFSQSRNFSWGIFLLVSEPELHCILFRSNSNYYRKSISHCKGDYLFRYIMIVVVISISSRYINISRSLTSNKIVLNYLYITDIKFKLLHTNI